MPHFDVISVQGHGLVHKRVFYSDDCARCGHPADWHRHDDTADDHDPTDPACPFRCLGYDVNAPGSPERRCDCPDFVDTAPAGEE